MRQQDDSLATRVDRLERELAAVRRRGRRMRFWVSCALPTCAAILSLLPLAATAIDLPTTEPSPGDPIRAGAVWENFNALGDRLPPVGTVVASMLTEEQMAAEHGGIWVLCAGQDVSASAYTVITGNVNAPDLRGLFVRGHNAGFAGSNSNPDDTALGAIQADAIAAHAHVLEFETQNNIMGSGVATRHLVRDSGDPSANSSVVTTSVGGTETRPRSRTLNYFIRID